MNNIPILITRKVQNKTFINIIIIICNFKRDDEDFLLNMDHSQIQDSLYSMK